MNLISKTIVAVIVTLFVATIATSQEASSQSPPPPKVTICHRNNNVNQPYGPKAIEVAQSSVDGIGNGDHYLEHTGPIATSATVAQDLKDAKTEWGDIIPPIANVHGGLNWTSVGQAIWESDCQFVEFVVAEPVVFTAPTCDELGTYTIPITEGVEYYVDNAVVAAGTYDVASDITITVTAKTITGYVFSDSSITEWSYDFVTPTDCDEDIPGVVLGEATTPQVTAKPAGAVNAGGSGTSAIAGLMAFSGIFSLGAIIRKFQV